VVNYKGLYLHAPYAFNSTLRTTLFLGIKHRDNSKFSALTVSDEQCLLGSGAEYFGRNSQTSKKNMLPLSSVEKSLLEISYYIIFN
jgi:hypothetical protein